MLSKVYPPLIGWACIQALMMPLPLIFAFFLLLGGCAPVKDTGTLAAASSGRQADREAFFSENLREFLPESMLETRAVEALRAYRYAYERFDIISINEMLAENFELLYTFDLDGDKPITMVQSQQDYLVKRGGWYAAETSRRELQIAVKGIKSWPTKGLTSITTATTHGSRYFSPRFLETFLFEDRDEKLRLSKIFMSPIYPAKPEDYEVGIYFAEKTPEFQKGFSTRRFRWEMISEGPDAAFDRYFRSLSTTAPGEAIIQYVPMFVIFREPPPEGAKIVVRERQLGGANRNFTSVQEVTQKGDPYFFLMSGGWYGCCYSVSVEVTMDGVVVGRQILQMP